MRCYSWAFDAFNALLRRGKVSHPISAYPMNSVRLEDGWARDAKAAMERRRKLNG